MEGTVDIIKNGYPYAESFSVSIAPTIDSQGNEIARQVENAEFEISITAGIDLTSVSTSIGTFNSLNNRWTIPLLKSGETAYLTFIATVTDETLSPYQVTLTGITLPGDDTPENNEKIKILGGLSKGDLLAELTGLTGPAGPAGSTGATPNITIGTVTAGSAAVTITGTTENPVLNFVLEQGPVGPVGPAGTTLWSGLTGKPDVTTAAGGNITGSINLLAETFNLVAACVGLTGNESIAGEKTFSEAATFLDSIDVTGDSAITGNLSVTQRVTSPQVPVGVNDLTNKAYVDAQIPVNVSQLVNDSGFVTANTQLSQEEVQDFMESALVHAFHTDVNVVYDDINNRYEFTSTVVGGGSDGVISNVTRAGDNLVFTGTGGGFNGTINDVFVDTQNTYAFSRVGDNIIVTENTIQIASLSIQDTIVTAHTHPISDITNLQLTLDGKQPTLVSGTNIKTVNGNSLVGSGDVVISTSYSHPNHTGDVTSVGDGPTTIAPSAISGKILVTAEPDDELLVLESSSGNLRRITVDGLNRAGTGDSSSQFFRGALSGLATPSDRTLMFPKTASQSALLLKEIGVYGENITGNIDIDIVELGGLSVATDTYQSSDGLKNIIVTDKNTNGYKIVLSESAANTSSSSIIGITLFYEGE